MGKSLNASFLRPPSIKDAALYLVLLWRCGCSLAVQWGSTDEYLWLRITQCLLLHKPCFQHQDSDGSREACLLSGLTLFSPTGFLLSNVVERQLALNFRGLWTLNYV